MMVATSYKIFEIQGSIPIDEEEDVDGDTNDNFVDPWGVVFKPLKVGQ